LGINKGLEAIPYRLAPPGNQRVETPRAQLATRPMLTLLTRGESRGLDGRSASDQELPLFRSFGADVTRSDLTFGAVERWGERNNAFSRRTSARLEAMFRQIPTNQRAALVRAPGDLRQPSS
jgi:hypothetical protein